MAVPAEPAGERAHATLTFMTGEGEVVPYEWTWPPFPRHPARQSHPRPRPDVSVSVHSSRPIVCERPMYFLYAAPGRGHCVTG